MEGIKEFIHYFPSNNFLGRYFKNKILNNDKADEVD